MPAFPANLRTATLSAACAIGLALSAAPAEASFVQVRDGNGGTVFNGGPGSQNVSIRVDGNDLGVAAGAFALQHRFSAAAEWMSFLTYCLEPDEFLGVSGSTIHNGNFSGSLAATAEYAAVFGDLSRLNATWFADSLTGAVKSAAFQVALWEVAYDSGRNLSGGAFRLNTTGAVRIQADAYLDAANWTADGDVGAVLRVGNQDLVVQVPEPASLALLGLGVAVLGAARRRRAA